MALFSRRRSSSNSDGGIFGKRRKRAETTAHLENFVATRSGVSAYFEAETPRDPSAIVLVAVDGEWTRRKVPSFSAAKELAEKLGISLFDVAATGYPRAMREWSMKNPGTQAR
ncbi:oxidoreductase [Trueperella bialowiezensis]|uniref:Uncharacterized protein n=1 Tax=Trueperella bialowiezensis TaxID=312285 RepID=A0A3S4V9G5_9ACTO|nr:oxidoreductase [Trueperella bialowiezensis]VEI12541.1 Uncharacterised protein [Trueperella bialowiezensis]